MITREIFVNTLQLNLSQEQIDKLLDLIETNTDCSDFIFHYYNSTAMIYDTSSDYFVTWYKLQHIGRGLRTNIIDIAILDNIVTELREIL